MTPRRDPASPPQIPGFTYERFLGGGGFADVFLYEQHRPHRKVAIKVLLRTMLSPAALEAFDDEADLMAQLSSHPSIVTIYEVGRAPDGRPYLVMQYCPGKNLGERFKRDPLGVADALRTGVGIAGAVETAHRAGILHRDIKPHNILVTEYNEPLLTDFGIASTVDDGMNPAEGLSIPWSPPESFADPPVATVATDVWALGATVYSLLAGRSPFEQPGRSNTSTDLMSRIETARPAPTGRQDVPASLERVLATAMGRTAEQRYPSALAFARALQVVQAELGFAATPVSVQSDIAERDESDADEDDPGTRIRRIQAIDPAGPASSRTGPPASATGPAPSVTGSPVRSGAPVRAPASPALPEGVLVDHTVRRGATGAWVRVPDAPPVEATVQRGPLEPDAESPGEAPEEPRTRGRLVAFGVVGVMAVGAIAFAVLSGGRPQAPGPHDEAPTTPTVPMDSLAEVAPIPTDIVGTVDGDQVVFTWSVPEPEDDDIYLWRVLSLVDQNPLERTDQPTATVPQQIEGQTCIEVILVRGGGQSPESARGCA